MFEDFLKVLKDKRFYIFWLANAFLETASLLFFLRIKEHPLVFSIFSEFIFNWIGSVAIFSPIFIFFGLKNSDKLGLSIFSSKKSLLPSIFIGLFLGLFLQFLGQSLNIHAFFGFFYIALSLYLVLKSAILRLFFLSLGLLFFQKFTKFGKITSVVLLYVFLAILKFSFYSNIVGLFLGLIFLRYGLAASMLSHFVVLFLQGFSKFF